MNPLKDRPLSKELLDTTVAWLLEEQEGFSAGRAAEFQVWRDADPRHERAIAKARGTLALLGDLPALKESVSAHFGEQTGRARPRRARLWTWVGASTAVAAAVCLAFLGWRGPGDGPNDFTVVSNADRPQQVVLEDGSFVDLNANTTIRTRMMPTERRVALREGEAHFAVAHDTSRPFIVEAAGVSVRAVGTAFTVRVSDQGVVVLVTEGKVEISGSRVGTDVHPPELVGAAERAVITRAPVAPGFVREKANEQELRAAVAWHSAVTTISSRPLREIVELFNRRAGVHLSIADPELGERNLGGSFSLENPETFIRLLELEGDVLAERNAKNERVLRLRR